MDKFYLTSPIYYVNADPHIGHAYTNIICDSMARFQRMQGKKVFFLTGTDEHGEKIAKAAGSQSVEIKDFVDEKAVVFEKLWQTLGVSYDCFIRTTCQKHKETVKKVIQTLYAKKEIYKAAYKAFYCLGCETFWTKSQLDDSGNCPECRRPVEQILEENYFFKLSKYQDWFKDYLRNNPGFIYPQVRYNEVKKFLDNHHLEDLCISRPKSRVSWGIDFPLDSDYVVYVWFDALLNYISAIDYQDKSGKFDNFWPADVHYIGKDILRHHAIFWPVMLKALGVKLPLSIVAHGWWKIEEEKISKSKGNIVNPFDLIANLTDLLGNQAAAVSSFRYFLLREMPVGLDGNFSLTALINRTNSDLANDLGNLAYRSFNMAEKYAQGKIKSTLKEIPPCLSGSFSGLKDNYCRFFACQEFSRALECLFEFIRSVNKYIEDSKPWNLKKENKEQELAHFLYVISEAIRLIAIYLYPVMPEVSDSIYRQLGIKQKNFLFSSAVWGQADSFLVKKEKPLFPRIDVN